MYSCISKTVQCIYLVFLPFKYTWPNRGWEENKQLWLWKKVWGAVCQIIVHPKYVFMYLESFVYQLVVYCILTLFIKHIIIKLSHGKTCLSYSYVTKSAHEAHTIFPVFFFVQNHNSNFAYRLLILYIHYSKKLKEHVDMIFIERYP